MINKLINKLLYLQADIQSLKVKTKTKVGTHVWSLPSLAWPKLPHTAQVGVAQQPVTVCTISNSDLFGVSAPTLHPPEDHLNTEKATLT